MWCGGRDGEKTVGLKGNGVFFYFFHPCGTGLLCDNLFRGQAGRSRFDQEVGGTSPTSDRIHRI